MSSGEIRQDIAIVRSSRRAHLALHYRAHNLYVGQTELGITRARIPRVSRVSYTSQRLRNYRHDEKFICSMRAHFDPPSAAKSSSRASSVKSPVQGDGQRETHTESEREREREREREGGERNRFRNRRGI